MTTEETPPPLDETSRAFLERHAHTGTPDDAQLARSRERLSRALSTAANDQVSPSRRRFPVPVEVLAVAAVVLVGVVAQVVWLAVRPPNSDGRLDAGTGLAAFEDAYRGGDLTAARLAAASCTEPGCQGAGAKLQRVLDLNSRFSTLNDDELDELARLDVELSGGPGTGLSKAVADRKTAPGGATVDGAALADQARTLSKNGKRDEAMALVERCIKESDAARCHLVRASLLAREAAMFGPDNEQLFSQARAEYQRFLELAPPSDEDVPKVRALLAGADPQPVVKSAPSARPDAHTLYVRADQLKEVNPAEAQRLFAELVAQTAPGDEWRDKAQARLRELEVSARELYLRGYQLKDSDPDEAARAFSRAMELSSPGSELHQKAKTRLAELGRAEPGAGPDTVRVPLGQHRQVPTPNLSRIAVGDEAVADVRAGGNQLDVLGVARGTTSVIIWRTDGTRAALLIVVE